MSDFLRLDNIGSLPTCREALRADADLASQARVLLARATSSSQRQAHSWSDVAIVTTEQSDAVRTFEAIQALYLSPNRPRDRQIADRITALHRDVMSEDEQILSSSLSQFTRFFLDHPELLFPRITMTPDGMLRARWIRGPEDFLAIEFTGRPLVKLVAEIPRDSETAAYFASEPISSVLDVSRALGAAL